MDIEANVHNLRTWKVEAGGSGIQGNPGLHGEFEAILGYVKPYLKRKQQHNKKQEIHDIHIITELWMKYQTISQNMTLNHI